MTRTTLLLILSLYALGSFSQQAPAFKSLTSEDGLSNGFVTCIYQDEQGFMWFGTAHGLNRYDGYEFRSWYSEVDNANSMCHDVIWTLFGSSDGTI